MRSLRVVQVVPSVGPEDGGPSTGALAINKGLLARGHQVRLFTTDANGPGRLSPDQKQEPENSPEHAIQFSPLQFPHRFRTAFGMLPGLYRAVRAADIVHVHGLYQFTSFVTPLLCRLFGKPMVLQTHGVLEPYQQHKGRLKKKLVNFVGGSLAISGAKVVVFTAHTEMDGASKIISPCRGVVIPLGATVSTPALVPRDCGWWSDRLAGGKKVLFLGRLSAKKRVDVLIKAHAALRRQLPDVHLLIAGPDTENLGPQLQNLVEGQDADWVHWLGGVYGDEKFSLLTFCDVFVLPSDNENFGIAVAEALAMGLPVVVTQGVALARDVKESELGIVISRPDPAELEDAMLSLLSTVDRDIPLRAMKYAQERFSWASFVERLECAYYQVLEQSDSMRGVGTTRALREEENELQH